MPFRSSFDCLWCGTAWTVRGSDDVEGWAQLCPDCVGKAGDNEFLRFRLRDAITERGAAGGAGATAGATPPGGAAPPGGPVQPAPPDDPRAFYRAPAPRK